MNTNIDEGGNKMSENIHSLIEEYVQKCNAAIKVNDVRKSKEVWYEVSGIFGALIPGYYDNVTGSDVENLTRTVGKLRVYSAKLHHDTEIAQCSQPVTTITQTTSIDINATFHQATNYVMDSDLFSPEETSEILTKIKVLKYLANNGEDKISKWDKVKPILEWAIARGVEIAPVIIPLIAAAIK
jgi:hypothetical protein